MNNIDYCSCPVRGEMLPLERFLLHHYIFLSCPSIVLEVGCGEGASTYYIAEALKKNGKGRVFTCDPMRCPPSEFLSLYNNVTYASIKSNNLIDYLIRTEQVPNFIFFDGPEDPQVALDDFQRLDPYLQPGTIFSMHDWCTGPNPRIYDSNISTKADLIKSYINSLKNWVLLEELRGDISNFSKEPDSVGLVFYQKSC